MKKLVLLVFALNICLGTFAQFTPGDTLKYRISLKDKAATDYSLQKPEMYLSKKSIERRKRQGLEIDSTDLPVCKKYVDAIRKKGVHVLVTGKWDNFVTVSCNDSMLIAEIAGLPFVRSTERVWRGVAKRASERDSLINKPLRTDSLYGPAITQIKMSHADRLHEAGFKGQGMTIAVIDVPKEEASRFGIMTCDENRRVTEFTEKPKEPKSTLASMGIYIFTWSKLKAYLIENENANTGSKDFGKDIIPSMLKNEERLFAYEFEGYWKDVGTLDSLWEANMDLLSPSVPLDLYDQQWKIYSRHNNMPPQYVGENAHIENSMITEGSNVDGTVDFSVISAGVTIEAGASVKYSIIMPGTTIKKGAVVEYAIIGENCVIESGARIGKSPESVENRDDWGIAVLGHDITVSENKEVDPKQIISENI